MVIWSGVFLRAPGAHHATGARHRGAGTGRGSELAADDPTRFVLPWLWKAGQTDGRALTPEGEEFGYELLFSRYPQFPAR